MNEEQEKAVTDLFRMVHNRLVDLSREPSIDSKKLSRVIQSNILAFLEFYYGKGKVKEILKDMIIVEVLHETKN